MAELRRISDLDKADPFCALCNGDGWVCESHDDVPWGSGDSCCGGAGMPCICNPLYHEGHTKH